MSADRKLSYKWLGLYWVCKVIPEKGTYELEEFNGTPLAGTYSGNRLKKFLMRKGLYEPVRTPDSPTSVDSESDDDDVLSPVAKEAADERMLSEEEDNEMEDPQEDPQPNKENAP